MKHFKYYFYLVAPLNKEANSKICNIEIGIFSMCSEIFHKYWTRRHHLKGEGSYLYKEGGMSKEEIYLKNQLVAFCKNHGYIGGVIPFESASRNWLKRCIHICWLMGAKSKEERKRIFGKWYQGIIFHVSFPLVFSDVCYLNCVDVIKRKDFMLR